MYGQDRALPWSTPPRRQTAPGGAPIEVEPSTTRHATSTNYHGMEGSESSGSGGFTPASPRGTRHTRTMSSGPATVGDTSGGGNGRPDHEKSYKDRVNQIIQAFFWKATMVVIQSRMTTVSLLSSRNEKKANKWFNIEVDEMDTFRDEMRLWRLGDYCDSKPPPLIIETYLDMSDLTATQALVITDEMGKRWNVSEVLEQEANRTGLNVGVRKGSQVVLERWKVDLSPPFDLPHHLELPVVYKKGIILFRALYSYLSLMPTWKFRRRLAKLKLHSSALKVGCRIQGGDEATQSISKWDGLQQPLYTGNEKVIEEFDFGKVESPAGFLNITVQYRKNCEFSVDDSEALLSSQFINLDEHHFRPSLGHQRTSSQPSVYATARGTEQGSLPPLLNPAYGSLTSFHQAERVGGASPITALRTAADMVDRASSNGSPIERPSTRSAQGSRSSLQSRDGIAPPSRRGSINFMQPFKSPSLSASPANSDPVLPASSLGRVATSTLSAQAQAQRRGLSVGTPSPSSFKSANSTLPPTEPIPTPSRPISESPRPQSMARITSSFGSRRPRNPSGNSIPKVDRTADDDNSSGHASYTSSVAAPSSGVLGHGAGTSSYEEGLQIRDFMSLLAEGQKTELKSFGGATAQASNRKTGNILGKYQKMRDSQSQLVESMSSSLLLQASDSPSSSSRNLSNVPAMIPSSTFSSSSSPGKPISPHTPHTPAIPSRLSEGLTARDIRHERRYPRPPVPNRTGTAPEPRGTATTEPLDIPRYMPPRRSNSMSQQHRENESRPSTSLGSADMNTQPLSISRLLDLQNASESILPGRETAESETRQETSSSSEGLEYGPVRPPQLDSPEDRPRSRYGPHVTRTIESSSSSNHPHIIRNRSHASGRDSTGSASSLERDGRLVVSGRTSSWSRTGEEDDLLFAMSEVNTAGRRSLEQQSDGRSDSSSFSRRRSRGGSGTIENPRGGDQAPGRGDRGWMNS
ncbi:autophagy-related protein 13-domain-containing protein [Geopyxis carbonaria]|nr:autophagy-related protein 13-domain-containing protein [Geopyxis carbonaria]